jgi:hypothetical protein
VKDDVIFIRINSEFKGQIKEMAEMNHRSLSGQVVYLLEKGIQTEEAITKTYAGGAR